MPQPAFFSDGHTPRLTDSRWTILVKWLGSIQTNLGGGAIAANNPKRGDTRRVLLQKIDSALSGVAYPG